MVFKTGNLFDPDLPNPPDVRLFAANGVVKRNGELVMDAGAAKAAKLLVPEAPAALGRRVREEGRYLEDQGTYVYGLAIETRMGLGAFQTKYHYRGRADLNLIALAAQQLALFASRHPDLRIAVNFPGVGLGQLHRGQVMGILEEFWALLPIEVWKLTPGRPSSRLPVYHLPAKGEAR
ncbi:hypothetical protein [Oceanithermus sp.]|uniref:hypothetical protein n=1 Tax=Oceanithermus sp. TaxID=2268145 RepID=UPI0025805131|nr:hypothetical protein [Oceanithermus sp.]